MESRGELRIETFVDPMFQQNGYVVWREGSDACWIIDPGLPPEPEEMLAEIESRGLAPAAMLLTHAHADHIAGVEPLRARLAGVPVWCPRGEAELLTSAEANLSAAMGFPIAARPAERYLDAGEVITLAGLPFECRDVAGHSPGGMAYVCLDAAVGESGGIAIVGDAVFADSIGRYDFPHSSRRRLISNIRANLLTLPPATWVFSGHGPPATIGDIRRRNRVLAYELQELGE